MPRNPEVNYWPSRGGYYTTFKGVQCLLAKGIKDEPDGPTYKEALKKFDEIVFGLAPGLTLDDLVAKYLGWAEHNLSPSTAGIRRRRLESLTAEMGHRHVSTITGYDVMHFCDGKRDSQAWSDGYVGLTVNALKMCLNWAVGAGLIEKNHLAAMKAPQSGSRGLECVVSPEEEAALLKATKGGVNDFFQALRDTGARPGELSRAEARHYDPALKALVFQASERDRSKRHKTHKTGRPRVIYLCGRSLEIVQRLCLLHPAGPLFRSPQKHRKGPHKGERWEWTQDKRQKAAWRLRRRTGLKHFISYSFRHTYAVRWLREGKPVAALAEVMGTSITMIKKHYGHLADQHDYLRRLVEELQVSRDGG